ncbi:MAG: hypothetical protein ACQESH_08300 [Campylobacterota bacterium]
MLYLIAKLAHIFSVLIYGGFLFTDNLILMRMQKSLPKKKYEEVRGYFKDFTRAIVPKALIVAVVSGIYLFSVHFGSIAQEEGPSNYQILLLIKAFLGLWLGIRGILQVFFGVQPLLFKSHRFPFLSVVVIVFISQVMLGV